MKSLEYLLSGFSLLLKPGVKRFVIIPLFINIVFFIGLYFVAKHFFSEFNHWLVSFFPSWLMWIENLISVIFFIGFVIIMLYAFATIANLISSPFNSLLSEKIEFYLTGNQQASRSFLEISKDLPKTLGRQFALIGYYLPRAFLIAILFFIPFIQFFAPIIWFIFNAWYFCLQYIDYPTDNHQISLKDAQLWMKKRRVTSLTFGIYILIGSMIPILNFLIMPASVAAATRFWIEENNS